MKRLLLGVIILSALVVVGHQWSLRYAKASLIGTLTEESGYPATVSSFKGFLPTGQIWLTDLRFKNLLPNGQTLDWMVPTANANLSLISYLFGSVEVQSLDLRNATWKTSIPSGWNFSGTANLQGASNNRPPSQADKDYLWCERGLLTLPLVQGQYKSRSHDLLYDVSLEVEPFCLKGSKFLLPFDFNLAANLTRKENSARFLAKGKHTPAEKKFIADIRLADLEIPVFENYLEIAALVPDFPKLKVADWIRGGSVSVQLRTETEPKQIKGDLTLRLSKVQFGPSVIDSKLTSETLRPILDSIQSRQDTLQLGPVSFSENLVTPESEAWEQIQHGMVAELIKNDPGAALKSGVKMLQDFFGK